ncbi:alpha/beta hydrolase [Actinomyces ruminis]|uniref:Alpha/beta hydrolase n=1 Tax=Actinomyces ruminis TaxID=1937003 RepID=A0ABX4ME27_9ACTO|nr:alpha/beta hydrolase [Actinomyces ruminis]PHP52342.1 alpha/beta hydrolase [Actinomyces ruminis]
MPYAHPLVGGEDWFDSHLDPDYKHPLAASEARFPANYRNLSPTERRQAQEPTFAPEFDWVSERVTWYDIQLPTPDAGRSVGARVYTPKRPLGGPLPAVLCIHGGGMWAGTIASEHNNFASISDAHGAVCVSVDYRLSPEHPYPAAIEDIVTVLHWMSSCAGTLGIDTSRVALFGASAGGGLALGTCLYVRDHGGPPIAFLQAIYPMLDDSSTTPSSQQVVRNGTGVWTRADNTEAWSWYLGDHEPTIYSSPARATLAQLEGLPPTYIDVGELDLFRDECLTMAMRLCAAGVPTELHLVPGVFHGAENVAPTAPASRAVLDYRYAAMHRHLCPDDPRATDH